MEFVWSQKGRTLALADTLVAAIASEQHCQLLTDNRKISPCPNAHTKIFAAPSGELTS